MFGDALLGDVLLGHALLGDALLGDVLLGHTLFGVDKLSIAFETCQRHVPTLWCYGLFGFGGFGMSKMCFVALAIKVFA